jgi:hypothetical protein
MHRALGLRPLFISIFLFSFGYMADSRDATPRMQATAVAQQPGAAWQPPAPTQVSAVPAPSAVPAQESEQASAQPSSTEPRAAPKIEARGIAVGAPKAFDNRTLNLMLERLKGQLAGINVIDQTALSKAIGTVQGSRIQETSRAFTIQGPGTASLQNEHDTTSNLTPPTSVPTTTDSTKQTITTPGITPSAPTVPDVISTPSALTNLQYGMSASDLLNEQVDLTYEIFNIQMLLDRSLSDRLLTPELKPRLQAVIGFNVTIDPPRDAENAAAVVEITLRCKKAKECTADGLEPSLVAAMPQEHTYNSVALNSKSNAFGGSAVIKMVSVGYSERRRGQTYYMFRDNDTISFQRQSVPRSGEITFGWAFRPVLGRKSVAPGTRQLFAVVSLPKEDVPDPFGKPEHFSVDVKAYWRKYDPGSLSTASDNEIRPWSKVGHVLSLGTSLTYPPGGETDVSGYDLAVPLTSSYLNVLGPTVRSVTWRPVGNKQAVIAVKGQNLYSDTKIVMGDRILATSQDGLRLLPDQALDITTDMSALVSDAAILGRYGPAIPLELTAPADKRQLGIIEAIRRPAAVGGYVDLTIIPEFENHGCLDPADLVDDKFGQPVLFLNGAPVAGPYQFPPLTPEEMNRFQMTGDCVGVFGRVPEAMMPKLSGVAMLRFPFRRGMSASQLVYDPNSVYTLQIVRAGVDYLLQKADGPFVPPGKDNFSNKNWRILVANDKPLEMSDKCPDSPPKNENVFCPLTPSDNLARISIGKSYSCSDTETTANPKAVPPPLAHAAGPKQTAPHAPKPVPTRADSKPKSCPPKILLLQRAYGDATKNGLLWQGTYPVSVPKDDSDTTKPSLDKNQSAPLTQHDAVWVSFTGTALSGVGEVTISETKLDINVAKDGKSIAVLIPKWATKDAANIDLTFADKQGSQIGTARINVNPNPSGAKK